MEQMVAANRHAAEIMEMLLKIHDDPANDVNIGRFGTEHNPKDAFKRVAHSKVRQEVLDSYNQYRLLVTTVATCLSKAIALPNPVTDGDSTDSWQPNFDDQSAKDCARVSHAYADLAQTLVNGRYDEIDEMPKLKLPSGWWHHFFGDYTKTAATSFAAALTLGDVALDMYYFQYASVGAWVFSPTVVEVAQAAPLATSTTIYTTTTVHPAGAVITATKAAALGSAKVGAIFALSLGVKVVIFVVGGYLVYRYFQDGHQAVDLYVPMPQTRINIQGGNDADSSTTDANDAIIILNIINALTLNGMQRMDTLQYYILLGVQELHPRTGSDFTEVDKRKVKDNYRMLSARFHPDKNSSASSTKVQQMINDAHDHMFPIVRG